MFTASHRKSIFVVWVRECSHGENGSKSFWWSNLWRWSASRALFVLIRAFRSTDLESFSVMIDQSCRSDNSVLVKASTSFVPKIGVFRPIRRPQSRAKVTARGTERFLVAVLNLFGLCFNSRTINEWWCTWCVDQSLDVRGMVQPSPMSCQTSTDISILLIKQFKISDVRITLCQGFFKVKTKMKVYLMIF